MASDEEIKDIEEKAVKKKPKRGIVYLATIPPYMNVTRIREEFGKYGEIGRVYMQLTDTDSKRGQSGKVKKKKIAKKFSEGWIEFERKSVAKKVATILNNKQVSTKKSSKQYDCIWNIKYLPGFKWVHLHERLAYEKAARRQKLRAEIEMAKKQTNFFTINLDKHKKKKQRVNKEYTSMETTTEHENEDNKNEERQDFLKSLFSN